MITTTVENGHPVSTITLPDSLDMGSGQYLVFLDGRFLPYNNGMQYSIVDGKLRLERALKAPSELCIVSLSTNERWVLVAGLKPRWVELTQGG